MVTHYVDNKHLYQVIIEHKQNIKDAEANGQPKPIIPNYVGHCILLIAKRLSLKPNFVNYSYREEMMGLRTVLVTLITLIPKNQLTLLHTLHR